MKHPPSLDEIRRDRPPPRNANRETNASLSPLNRIAVWITDRVGSMGFFFTILAWSTLWLGWNFLAPTNLQFDPPMGFVFWLFISNLLQILLMPLIMVGQNIQSLHAEKRVESDLEVNLKAEREIEAVIRHLEYQNALLHALLKQQGISLEQAAEPEHG